MSDASMTRLEGSIQCLPCAVSYGTVYAELVNDKAQVWANRTEPVDIPKYCGKCAQPLTRVRP